VVAHLVGEKSGKGVGMKYNIVAKLVKKIKLKDRAIHWIALSF